MQIILTNRRTRKNIELSLEELNFVFNDELEKGINEFIMESELKHFYSGKAPSDETDFYFDLRFNFNTYVRTDWFIEKIISQRSH